MTFQYDSGATGFDSSPIIWNDDPGHVNWESWVTNDSNFGWSHGTYRAILDIDGDGLPDRVTNNDNATSLKVFLNNGSGFEPTPIIWNDDPGHANWESWVTNDSNHDGWSHGTYRAILDIDGNGLPDRVTNNDQATSLKVYLNQFRPPLMTGIIASNGARSSVEYQSSRKFDNTTLGGKPGLPFNVWVVSKVTTSGPSVETRSVSYDYKGGLFQRDVKEFRGFRIVTQTDDQTGIETRTKYHQDIVFQGRPKKITSRLNGMVVSKAVNTWSAKEYDGGQRHFPYVKQSDSKAYELDGSLVTHQTSDATYDDFGNPIQATVDFQDGHTKTTVNTFSNDTANWILGKLTHAEVTAVAPGQPVQTRASAFTYDALGRLTSEIIEPDNPNLSLVTSYTYDTYGNRLTTTVTGSGIASRTTTVTYDANGQFPVSTTNALGHFESYVYDARWGVMSSLTGPNGLTTAWEYDGFGRQVKETRADGTYTDTTYHLDVAPFYVKTESFGSNGVLASPPVTTYYDVLGRGIQKETLGFSGNPVYADTAYDSLGRVASKSRPYAANSPIYETTYAYDDIGRAVSMTAPDGSVSQTAYGGLTTTSTNPLGQTRTEIKNSQGQLAQVIDAMGGSMSYEYDAFGNLKQTVDALNNITTMAYDIRSRKIAMNDPDMGDWTYTYDPVGNLISQTDAKAQTTVMVYDMLNRMVSRFEVEGVSTWVYDNSPGKGVGKLAMSTAPNGSTKNYTYDDFGRSTWTNTRVNGVDYLTYTSYDPASRVSKIQYPTGVTVIRGYTMNGHLQEVRNFDTGVVYWRADVVDAEGRVLDETLGNGLTTHRQFNPLTGALEVIVTGTGLGGGGSGSPGGGTPAPADTDGDGMPDDREIANGLQPNSGGNNDAAKDYEGDGYSNIQEYQNGTDPYMFDPGGPAVGDSDGDGMPDTWETQHGLDPGWKRDGSHDADGDGVSNINEYQYGADPNIPNTDGDSLPDVDEVYLYGTDPASADTEGDGMPDDWEIQHGLNPVFNDSANDNDGDGYSNILEYQNGTDPNAFNVGGSVSSEAQNLQYVYDSLGNLTSRTDYAMGFTESFAYDQLNRLTGVSGPSAKSYAYDIIGNITYKSDVGAYAYGASNAGPHAVTSAGGNTYSYDANGNMVSGGGRTISYTSFNKPSQVQTATATTVYGYDANHNRLTKYTGATTTTYIGKLYERVNAGGVIKHKHYVYAAGRLISTIE